MTRLDAFIEFIAMLLVVSGAFGVIYSLMGGDWNYLLGR